MTVVGAISLKKVIALMTLNGALDGKAFEVFVKRCLVPQLWSGAVVVMDNLPAHHLGSIAPALHNIRRNIKVM